MDILTWRFPEVMVQLAMVSSVELELRFRVELGGLIRGSLLRGPLYDN